MRIISDIQSMSTFMSVCHDELFLQEPGLHYRPYRNSFFIQDLRDALKTGKECPSFSLSYDDQARWLDLISEVDGDLSELLSRLVEKTDSTGLRTIELGYGVTAHRGNTASIRTFSPFALDRFKPITEAPPKWTLAHARRALANGQFERLRCDGVYTDDYAFDDVTNFQKGALKPLGLLRSLIESPDGWWTVLNEDGTVGVSCHSFEHNSFTLKLDNRAPALEAEVIG